jgi:hypothetical protein
MLIPFVLSKPMRLKTSSQVGNKVFGCVVCRFHVAARKAKLGRGAIYKLSEAVANQQASPSVVLSALLLNDKPWFLN